MDPQKADIKIFINYTHDSELHKERVAQLKAQLFKDGINCIFDGDQQSPPEGWPLWCENQIEEADFVLVICTETYHNRYKLKEEEGKGRGAKWEGNVIRQELYNADGRNKKFIPVVFENKDKQFIPAPLQGVSCYNLQEKEEYVKLYARITGQKEKTFPEKGKIRSLSPQSIKPLFGDSDPFEEVLKNTGVPISRGPIRFSFDDLRSMIESVHEVVIGSDPSSESQFDFSDMNIERKNELNEVGEDFYETVLREDEIHVGPIQDFLQHPANQHIKDLYHEIVDELRRKLAVIRPEHANFEALLTHLSDAVIENSPDRLKGKRRTLNVLLSFMYLNCDIGRKA